MAEVISHSTIQQKEDTNHVVSALEEINKGSKQHHLLSIEPQQKQRKYSRCLKN